eukprot:Skav230844  [mRNA]  locus=scaffold3471:169667:173653:+ [translate_table: standard]
MQFSIAWSPWIICTAKVALYFSAHWCPPCRGFTPQLAAALAGDRFPQIKVVFCSSDRSEGDFQSYYAEMPWLALPFGSPQKDMLGMTYQAWWAVGSAMGPWPSWIRLVKDLRSVGLFVLGMAKLPNCFPKDAAFCMVM